MFLHSREPRTHRRTDRRKIYLILFNFIFYGLFHYIFYLLPYVRLLEGEGVGSLTHGQTTVAISLLHVF